MCPCSPTGRGSSFKHCLVRVRILPGIPALVAQLAEATALNTAECWFESSRGHHVAVVQPARAPPWYGGDPGATPVGGSIHLWRRSLRAGLKHRRCRCDTCRMDHLEGQADWRRPPFRKRASASLGRSTRPPSASCEAGGLNSQPPASNLTPGCGVAGALRVWGAAAAGSIPATQTNI